MAIGETFLSAFLQVLFDRLASKHVLDFVRGHAIEKDLKRLKKTLKNVELFLNDAEDKQLKSKAVKKWLDELKDAAYDAEDALDEFATEAFRRKLEADQSSQTSSIQLWSSAMSAYLSPSNGGIENKITLINNRFHDLAEERFELGLEKVAAGSPSIEGRETSSVMNESCVYGRDEDKKKIIQLMLNDEPGSYSEISVVSIIAMGGAGKTTLAQFVYNDNAVNEQFDLKAWVCVSEEFDAKRVTRDILYDFTFKASDSDNLNQLQVRLEKVLTGKRFLIVLDDVWSKNYRDWDVLQNPFRAGATGSKIIVTTREKDVALMMGTAEYHYLERLSDDDCWLLFVRHAFVKRDIDAKPKLAVIGKKLVEKCKGLPLAAKMLGGLLRSKFEEDEWEDILNSKIWEPEVVEDILPMLRLSYHHLPSHLKRCFIYCAIFPKDYEFKEMELVLLWMAEGLVQQQPDGNKQMEDIGLSYFRELWSRSFFQPSSNNESLFVVHDLINDLAQWVAGKICFRLEGGKQCKLSKKARHSSYLGSRFDGVKKFEAFDKVKNLRTFLPLMTKQRSFLTNYVPVDLLPSLSCLRVLSLSGYCITELPESIGNLKHLRYVDLAHTHIRSLPESTSTLYNLQTLILEYCSFLKKLPTKMRNLINLRHLNITHAILIREMPLGIGELTSLQKLSNFIVGSNSGSRIGELMNINHLRGTLCISRLENVIRVQDARAANLKDKQDLVVLKMEWTSKFDGSRNEVIEKEVLEMLQPHKMLEELTIKCYSGIGFPTWVGDPCFSNMVLVRLENCVKCTSLPPLGQLPLLKDLCIKRMNGVNIVGAQFYGEGCLKPFQSLETLRFVDMQEWEDWFSSGVNTQVEVFPQLRELSIVKCPKLLGTLPDDLPLLEKLVIDECKRLVVSISSLPKLSKLDIRECQEVVRRNTIELGSLKSIVFSNISKLTCLTEGFWQGLTKLEDLEIGGCSELTCLWQKEVGLLQHFNYLSHLKIEHCPMTLVAEEEEVEQHQQGRPCRLESLELNRCDNLEKLQGLHNLASLRKLTILACRRLVSFPKTGLPPMLRELEIENCNALTSLPLAMMHCSNYGSLEYLNIYRCHSLTFIARGQLPSTLKTLHIQLCKNLWSLLDEEGSSLHTSNSSNACLLEDLHIKGCPSLMSLSLRGELPATLKVLCILYCPKLKSVADRMHNNTSLELIEIWDCESLNSLPEGLHNLVHLSCVSIRDCPNLVSFPDGGFPATSLRDLWINNCDKLEALPHRMYNLTSLQELIIGKCPTRIVAFPEGGLPTNLTVLDISDLNICKPLSEWDLHLLTSLQHLSIKGVCPNMVSFPEEEDKGMILPTSLTILRIEDFPNLEYLSSQGFQNLTSLEELMINDCPKLKSFPEKGLPPSLWRLYILSCPLLQLQCRKDQGIYWHRIAHIPLVQM